MALDGGTPENDHQRPSLVARVSVNEESRDRMTFLNHPSPIGYIKDRMYFPVLKT